VEKKKQEWCKVREIVFLFFLIFFDFFLGGMRIAGANAPAINPKISFGGF
jgi:hypothetical protein